MSCRWLLLAGVLAGHPLVANDGVVATVHPLADRAAREAFDQGGNAIDAAVAAGLTLGVVDGFNSGIGGGCFIVIRTTDGKAVAIDGRETAPAAASRDLFVRDGEADPALSRTGALAVGVPGALAAYAAALDAHGTMSLAELLGPAAAIAAGGFELDAAYVSRLASVADELKDFPESRRILLQPDGRPWPVGHRLVQRDLAASYRAITAGGIDWFYRGPFAEETSDWMRRNGGIVTRQDFRDYRAKQREPVRTTYRGFEILGFPPPSSGGVHLAQILNILERFDLRAMGSESAEFVHVVAEAMKLAFADRAHWLGDPDFAEVPRGLVDKAYARTLSRRIRPGRAGEVAGHGTPPDLGAFGGHTTHFTTADAEGNWVAITATINTTFGAKVIVPGTGIVLNNEMDDFSAQPGKPNFFGLVGAEANAVEAGKRPLSSMSPTIVLKDGQPVFAAGAAGGPTIISQTLLAVIQFVDFGRMPTEALEQPRFHHQWKPDRLRIERGFGGEVLDALRAKGHELEVVDEFGACQAIGRDAGGALVGARDPRVRASAAAR